MSLSDGNTGRLGPPIGPILTDCRCHEQHEEARSTCHVRALLEMVYKKTFHFNCEMSLAHTTREDYFHLLANC
jgi:hypothetical protein